MEGILGGNTEQGARQPKSIAHEIDSLCIRPDILGQSHDGQIFCLFPLLPPMFSVSGSDCGMILHVSMFLQLVVNTRVTLSWLLVLTMERNTCTPLGFSLKQVPDIGKINCPLQIGSFSP